MSCASSVSSGASTLLIAASQNSSDKFGSYTRHCPVYVPLSTDEPSILSSKELWDCELTNMSDAVHPLFELRNWRTNLPHFLFRASYHRPVGAESRTTIVRRPTQANCYHTSILDIPFVEAKEMLEAHLLQRTTRASEFTSWSSSLLVTLLDATRKADYQQEAVVCIDVLNTRKLTMASVFPATMLLRAYGIKSEEELSHGIFSHEYLVHGAIGDESCFSVAGLQQLRECGLCDLFPELGVEQGKKALSQRVDELRLKFFAHVWPVTMSGVGPLRDLAMCFGPEWVLPMTVAFLCLRLRHHKGRRYPQALLQELGDLTFPGGYVFEDHLFRIFYCDSRDLPEVSQFSSLLRRLCVAKYSHLPLWKDGDVEGELGDLIVDLSGIRSLALYSRDAEFGSAYDKWVLDEDSSSEEEGSFYEEEADWKLENADEEPFKGSVESWTADGAAKVWDMGDAVVEQDN